MAPKNNSIFSYASLLKLLLILSSTFFSSMFCQSKDTITSKTFIKDPATITSNNSSFELGFFTPRNSTARYVGIWFKNISPQSVVWVANPNNPLNDTSGIFTISNDGNLVVLDRNSAVLWSSNVSSSSSTTNTTGRILDSGNLVLEDSVSGNVLWESFKHPSDKFLTFMKLITNRATKENVKVTSWNNPSNPSSGNFSFTLDVQSIPEMIVQNGVNMHWRSGPWNGRSFFGIHDMDSVYLSGFNLIIDDQTYTLSIPHSFKLHEFAYLFLTPQGDLQDILWDDQTKQWSVSWSALKTECDYYGACGEFGICNPKMSPVCMCLRGFEPKNEDEWNRGNWSNGCVRKAPLKCEKSKNSSEEEDGFLKMEMVKVPYFVEWSLVSLTANNCSDECLSDCSCNAYAFEDGIRCMLWRRKGLIDIQKFEIGGVDLYIRLPFSELDHTILGSVKEKKGIIIGVVLPATFIIFIITISFWWKWRKTHKQEKKEKEKILKLTMEDDMDEDGIKLEELPFYDYEKLAIATNNFDLSNKLGQGGFGPVYKGKLLNGQEIAVKRLSRTSNQGYEEFINEVKVISKLQHRNLVRLFGCCIQGEEKMLIYEYMPHLSLDALIFGSHKLGLLDWRKRFIIIEGIARGLLYLHRDSRLKIIHRDLKASNILLDKDLNPKISDFGMARIFYGNEAQARTLKIAGTYGYMSPEYAMQGKFSEKSDIFSFGVLLLEIVSGKRNTEFHHSEYDISLLGFVWKLWKEGNLIPLIEPTIHELCYQLEILRCIHVGLLCVQEFINDRPNISTIISMLNSEIVDLPSPKQPAFVGTPRENRIQSSQQNLDKVSTNDVTFTTIIAR